MTDYLGIDFRFLDTQPTANHRRDDGPLKILLLGDFSGRTHRGVEADLADRPALAVDIDNFDHILSRCSPQLPLQLNDMADIQVTVPFHELDDFHPDRLYRTLAIFKQLRHTRQRLTDPQTFAEAANALLGPGYESPPTAPPAAPEADAATPFERLLGKAPSAASAAQGSELAAVTRLLKSVVQPHIVSSAPRQQSELVRSIDQATSELMRGVLHAPDFQALEAVWRGLHWLISQVATDEDLQIHILDASRSDIEADLVAAEHRLEQTGLYRSLLDQHNTALGKPRWSLICGLYRFGPDSADLRTLAALGGLAAQLGAAFVAGASPRLLGGDGEGLTGLGDPNGWRLDAEASHRWSSLRQHPVASHIGLVMPRLLLRSPYGDGGERLELFEFEEFTGTRGDEDFLWGNGAIVCALLIAQAFKRSGWSLQPGEVREVEGLPMYVYREHGDSHLQACAEVYLSDQAAEAMLQRGLMPLLSYRNRNQVRLLCVQSIADPSGPLRGPWG